MHLFINLEKLADSDIPGDLLIILDSHRLIDIDIRLTGRLVGLRDCGYKGGIS